MKRLNWTVRVALIRGRRHQRVADAVGMFTITIISMSPQSSYNERTSTNILLVTITTAIGRSPKSLRWAGRIDLCHL